MSRTRDLLAALVHAHVGGFLAQPPGFDGEHGLGLVGVHGVPRARTWDAVASASAPGLIGDTVAFVVLEDGTIVLDDDQPDDSLAPLADAIEAALSPPYRAAAVRSRDDIWAAVAQRIAVVALAGLEGDVIDMTIVAGVRALSVDGEHTIRPLPALDGLAEGHGDVVLHAERVDDDLFAVDLFPL